jgi:hypothetical protein
MREIRQSGSEGGARFNPLSLPLLMPPGTSTAWQTAAILIMAKTLGEQAVSAPSSL